MTKQDEIRGVTRQIIAKHKPNKIFLFGSFAWGKPGKDSDVDLLIIKKAKKTSRKLAQEIDESLAERNFPLDILVYSPGYFKKRLLLGDQFAKKIIKDGKLLYEERK